MSSHSLIVAVEYRIQRNVLLRSSDIETPYIVKPSQVAAVRGSSTSTTTGSTIQFTRPAQRYEPPPPASGGNNNSIRIIETNKEKSSSQIVSSESYRAMQQRSEQYYDSSLRQSQIRNDQIFDSSYQQSQNITTSRVVASNFRSESLADQFGDFFGCPFLSFSVFARLVDCFFMFCVVALFLN